MATATRPTRTADPEAEPIDATARLITPERVVFTYPLAGPARRALSYAIDACVLLVILGLLLFLNVMLFAFGSFSQAGLALAAAFVLVWGYGAVAEGAFNGRTVGKSLVGLRVLTTEGVPITGSQATIRNLIGTIDGPFPFLFVPGLASMALTRRFQRLGDLAAGTMVVVEQARRETKLARVDDRAVADLLEYLPLRVAATPDQARAVADYVRSRGRFLPDRREEIARHLAVPLRERYSLPESSPGDVVLCAYYHRIFLEDRLADRQAGWQELNLLLFRLETSRAGRLAPEEVVRLGELYRAACADLMLAEAHDFSRETVEYLDALVGRAHNAVYRTRGFRWKDWAALVLDEVPRRLRADPLLRVSALVFWGLFLLCGLLAAADPEFTERVVGERMVQQMESMYDEPLAGNTKAMRNDAAMAGFYIWHNAGIGLGCYAQGLLLGLGTLYTLASNAVTLGAVFGHMARVPQGANFYTFVTAHGPFELTAIVFSGAAGLRLGSGLIVTRGESRLASLRREAAASLPTAGVATILFVFAAFLEGFVSASALPYAAKALIAAASAALLLIYLLVPGRARAGGRDFPPPEAARGD